MFRNRGLKQRQKEKAYLAQDTDFSNKESVIRLLKKFGEELENASEDLKADFDVVLTAVRSCGRALEYTTPELQNNYEIVIEAVKDNGKAYLYANEELQNIREIVLYTVSQNGNMLEHIPEHLKSDPLIILVSIYSNPRAIDFVPKAMLDCRDFVLQLVTIRTWCYTYISPRLRKDREIILLVSGLGDSYCSPDFASYWDDIEFVNNVMQKRSEGKYISLSGMPQLEKREIILDIVPKFQNTLPLLSMNDLSDKIFILEILGKCSFDADAIEWRKLSSVLLNDEAIAFALISNVGSHTLRYLGNEMKQRKDIVALATAQDPGAIAYASPSVKSSWEFVYPLLERDPIIIKHVYNAVQNCKDFSSDTLAVLAKCYLLDVCDCIPSSALNDENFMLSALLTTPGLLVHSELKSNKCFVAKAMKINGSIRFYVTDDILDRKMLLDGLSTEPHIIYDIIDNFPPLNKEILLKAFSGQKSECIDSDIIDIIPLELFGDKEVVLALLRGSKCWRYDKIFEFIPESLKQDFDVLMAAARNSSLNILFHCSETFKANREIVLTAISEDPSSIQLASEELQYDIPFLVEAFSCSKNIVKHLPSDLKYNQELVYELIKGRSNLHKDWTLFANFFAPLTIIRAFSSFGRAKSAYK